MDSYGSDSSGSSDWSPTASASLSSSSVASSYLGRGNLDRYGAYEPARQDEADEHGNVTEHKTFTREVTDPKRSRAVAKAGSILRKTAEMSEKLNHLLDGLASGQSFTDTSSKMPKKVLNVSSNKGIQQLEAELELVNKRLRLLKQSKPPAGHEHIALASVDTQYVAEPDEIPFPRNFEKVEQSSENAVKVSDQRLFQDIQQLATTQPVSSGKQESRQDTVKAPQSGSLLPARPWRDDSDAPLEVLLSNELGKAREELKEQQRTNESLQRSIKDLLGQVKKRDETIQHLFSLVSERDFTIAMLKQTQAPANATYREGRSSQSRKKSLTSRSRMGDGDEIEEDGSRQQSMRTTSKLQRRASRVSTIAEESSVRDTARSMEDAPLLHRTLVLLDQDSNIRYTVSSYDEPFTIGRSSNCSLPLDRKLHPSVSRTHAKIYFDSSAQAFDIQDSSTTGTAVNDDSFQNEVFKELQVGDVITIGGAATGKRFLVESITDTPE
uniref:FHA domain-containing protein n=1 Tax=Hanusia phi TaxID=3032 RepID=A0A7S0EX07_9CRYP|mmetsp:Transcript_33476/g.75103  ORF Transcript_33476/g.75103 Transcript_33476/m.75103 type:complete len:496 (+) Transcript_33476:171-1658(+)